MTKHECLMTKERRNPNDKKGIRVWFRRLSIRICFVIRHSCFVILIGLVILFDLTSQARDEFRQTERAVSPPSLCFDFAIACGSCGTLARRIRPVMLAA